MSKFDQGIARGIKLLDENCASWRTRININRLDMSIMFDCILGQVYGDYCKGLDTLNLYVGMDHGFNCYNSSDYETLKQEWIKHITGD
jgi:hypothetical protein